MSPIDAVYWKISEPELLDTLNTTALDTVTHTTAGSYLMRKLRTISRRSMADLTLQSIVQSISVQVPEPPGHMTTLSVPAMSTEREIIFSSTKKLLSPIVVASRKTLWKPQSA